MVMPVGYRLTIGVLDNFKRPEYTGLNRCYPCTALNVVLLVGLGILASFVSGVGAVILVTVGAITIWLRGYFLPYTPRIGPWITDVVAGITGREMLAKPRDGSLASSEVSGEMVVEELLRTNVLNVGDDEDLALSGAFRNEWRAKMSEVRTLDVDEFEQWAGTVIQNSNITGVEAKEQLWSDPYVVVSFASGDESILQYPVAVAEFSSLTALEDIGLEPTVRLHASGPLRGFLTECPLCDTSLEVSRYSGCCGNPRRKEEKLGLVCKECRTVLYKYPE